MLSVSNISASYGIIKVARERLLLPRGGKGECVALLGSNGAGKLSTILKNISGWMNVPLGRHHRLHSPGETYRRPESLPCGGGRALLTCPKADGFSRK